MRRGGSVAATGRGRGSSKDQSEKELLPSQNGIGKKLSDDIEIFHTDTLIEEVGFWPTTTTHIFVFFK